MADKLNDLASRLSKGTPKGLGVGATLLFGATAAIYGVYKSMFTGMIQKIDRISSIEYVFIVEGGHRAIIFNRIGGIDQNTIHSEGLHFR
jgi:prohibitin 2